MSEQQDNQKVNNLTIRRFGVAAGAYVSVPVDPIPDFHVLIADGSGCHFCYGPVYVAAQSFVGRRGLMMFPGRSNNLSFYNSTAGSIEITLLDVTGFDPSLFNAAFV